MRLKHQENASTVRNTWSRQEGRHCFLSSIGRNFLIGVVLLEWIRTLIFFGFSMFYSSAVLFSPSLSLSKGVDFSSPMPKNAYAPSLPLGLFPISDDGASSTVSSLHHRFGGSTVFLFPFAEAVSLSKSIVLSFSFTSIDTMTKSCFVGSPEATYASVDGPASNHSNASYNTLLAQPMQPCILQPYLNQFYVFPIGSFGIARGGTISVTVTDATVLDYVYLDFMKHFLKWKMTSQPVKKPSGEESSATSTPVSFDSESFSSPEGKTIKKKSKKQKRRLASSATGMGTTRMVSHQTSPGHPPPHALQRSTLSSSSLAVSDGPSANDISMDNRTIRDYLPKIRLNLPSTSDIVLLLASSRPYRQFVAPGLVSYEPPDAPSEDDNSTGDDNSTEEDNSTGENNWSRASQKSSFSTEQTTPSTSIPTYLQSNLFYPSVAAPKQFTEGYLLAECVVLLKIFSQTTWNALFTSSSSGEDGNTFHGPFSSWASLGRQSIPIMSLCTAPSLYTIHLVDSTGENFKKEIQYEYQLERLVLVVVQCSPIPVQFNLLIDLQNVHGQGSSEAYTTYRIIIWYFAYYVLLLVYCVAVIQYKRHQLLHGQHYILQMQGMVDDETKRQKKKLRLKNEGKNRKSGWNGGTRDPSHQDRHQRSRWENREKDRWSASVDSSPNRKSQSSLTSSSSRSSNRSRSTSLLSSLSSSEEHGRTSPAAKKKKHQKGTFQGHRRASSSSSSASLLFLSSDSDQMPEKSSRKVSSRRREEGRQEKGKPFKAMRNEPRHHGRRKEKEESSWEPRTPSSSSSSSASSSFSTLHMAQELPFSDSTMNDNENTNSWFFFIRYCMTSIKDSLIFNKKSSSSYAMMHHPIMKRHLFNPLKWALCLILPLKLLSVMLSMVVYGLLAGGASSNGTLSFLSFLLRAIAFEGKMAIELLIATGWGLAVDDVPSLRTFLICFLLVINVLIVVGSFSCENVNIFVWRNLPPNIPVRCAIAPLGSFAFNIGVLLYCIIQLRRLRNRLRKRAWTNQQYPTLFSSSIPSTLPSLPSSFFSPSTANERRWTANSHGSSSSSFSSFRFPISSPSTPCDPPAHPYHPGTQDVNAAAMEQNMYFHGKPYPSPEAFYDRHHRHQTTGTLDFDDSDTPLSLSQLLQDSFSKNWVLQLRLPPFPIFPSLSSLLSEGKRIRGERRDRKKRKKGKEEDSWRNTDEERKMERPYSHDNRSRGEGSVDEKVISDAYQRIYSTATHAYRLALSHHWQCMAHSYHTAMWMYIFMLFWPISFLVCSFYLYNSGDYFMVLLFDELKTIHLLTFLVYFLSCR